MLILPKVKNKLEHCPSTALSDPGLVVLGGEGIVIFCSLEEYLWFNKQT